jgi:ribosomal protein S27E
MNPMIAAALHLLKKKGRRERRCRACGNRQPVGEKQAALTVACRRCGKPIPPPKA